MIIRDGDDFRVRARLPTDLGTDSNCLLIVTRDPDIECEITEVTENSLTVNAEIINPYHRTRTPGPRRRHRPVVNAGTIEACSGTHRVEFSGRGRQL